MSRRDFRTPASLPTETTGRCIVLPNDAAWLGLLNAALLMLTETWRYDQVEASDLTAEQTAAVFYDIYVQSLAAECGANMFNVRQPSGSPCRLEKTEDGGETWTPWADLLACYLPYVLGQEYSGDNVRTDPVTDKPQITYDGGTTWTDIPEDPNPGITVPPPNPTIAASEEDKKCLAARRAALTIAEFYKQTFGAFTAGLMNAIGTINEFLHSVNMALFDLVYSPYEGVLEAAGWFDYDFVTNYTAGELDANAVFALTCLLSENATVAADDRVTFDFQAVYDNVIAELGLNPGAAVTLLLGNIQAGGLDRAGSVLNTYDDQACCGMDCGEYDWCYEFDFTAEDAGFVSPASGMVSSCTILGACTRTNGVGWQSRAVGGICTGVNDAYTARTLNFNVRRIEADFTRTVAYPASGYANLNGIMAFGGTTSFVRPAAGQNGAYTLTLDLNKTVTSLSLLAGGPGGDYTIRKARIYGYGSPPL